MITSTITTTIATHDHLVMSLTGTSNNKIMEVNCEKIINDLVGIIDKYKDWNDLVSFNIIEWSIRSLNHVECIDRENPNNILDVIQSDVNELFNEVLISTYLTPLKDPILLGDFTWESKELTDYYETYKYYPKSPFYEQELNLSSKKTHLFAIEMLEWAGSLPLKQTEESAFQLISIHSGSEAKTVDPDCLLINSMDIEKANNQLPIYLKCEEIASRQLNMHKINQSFNEATKELQVLAAKVHEHLQIAVDAARLHAEEEKDKNLQLLEEIKDSHKRTVEDLKVLIENNKNTITETSEKLNDSMSLCEIEKREIEELKKKLERQYFQIKRLEKKAEQPGCIIV